MFCLSLVSSEDLSSWRGLSYDSNSRASGPLFLFAMAKAYSCLISVYSLFMFLLLQFWCSLTYEDPIVKCNWDLCKYLRLLFVILRSTAIPTVNAGTRGPHFSGDCSPITKMWGGGVARCHLVRKHYKIKKIRIPHEEIDEQ